MNKQAMLKGFDAFTDRIIERYKEARQALDDEDYIKAQDILASLGVSHARTSLSLRNYMVREGLLNEEDR